MTKYDEMKEPLESCSNWLTFISKETTIFHSQLSAMILEDKIPGSWGKKTSVDW